MRSGSVLLKPVLLLWLSLSLSYSHAQEICNNGIDDDGDGKIDLNDEYCTDGIFNLIRNPSFETIGGCPDNWSKLHYAINWMQPHPTAGSTDLYHKCGGCQHKLLGFSQQAPIPAPHGDGFAGFYDTKQYDAYGEYKEYLSTCMSSPLQKDVTYRLQFSLGFLTALQDPNATNSKSPVSISFFGNPSCSAVQYSTGFRRCPMTMSGAGWTELKKITVVGNPGSWVTMEAEFVAPANINGLVIGPSCEPNVNDGSNYYFIDNILLYEKDDYHIPQLERKGDICADTLVLTGKISPAPPAAAYQWYKNGIALQGETGLQLKLTRARYGEGNYSIMYTIGGTNYLSTEELITINDLQFYIEDSVALCQNKVLISPQLQPVQPSCAITFLWQDGSTNATFEASSTGLHWFETNKDGCRFRDSVYVYNYPAPVVNLGADTTLCPGEQLALKAGDNTQTYLWQDASTKNEYQVTNAGSYFVIASNQHCSTRDTIVVKYAKLPEVRFEQDSIICENEEKILKPFLDGDEFLWNTGSTAKEITITTPGLYQVTAKNECGEVSKSINITVSNCQFYLPDAFTPNGDGLNDAFGLKEYGFIRQYKISVYNRWGEMVYQSINPAGRWSGLFKGKAAPQAVYVWMADYTDWLGRKARKKGTVVLIR